MLHQRCATLFERRGPTLCNVEKPTLDFVSFSTSDRRYFNVNPQRWNDVEMLAGEIIITNLFVLFLNRIYKLTLPKTLIKIVLKKDRTLWYTDKAFHDFRNKQKSL